MSEKEKYKVFLITWERTVDIPEEGRIALVLNLRNSEKKIKKMMEALYYSKYYSIEEQLAMAKYNKPSKGSYHVEKHFKNEEFGGIIKRRVFLTCGANPFLKGRAVENFHVKHNAKGGVSYEWDEKK